MRASTQAEIQRLAVTMSVPAIAKQLGVDRSTVFRLLGWRWSMPEAASILPAPPEEVYALMMARTRDPTTIRRRIDVFCRIIPDRTVAKAYRRDLLAVHRTQPARPIPVGLPAPANLHTRGKPRLPYQLVDLAAGAIDATARPPNGPTRTQAVSVKQVAARNLQRCAYPVCRLSVVQTSD